MVSDFIFRSTFLAESDSTRGKTMKPSKSGLFTKTAIGAILASAFCSTAAHAQLDEIVVTATKSEKSVQDVALSIEAVSGEFLEDFRVEGLKGLSDNIPNFTVSSGLTATNISMRGLGSGQERSFEQAVGMFIDGQYMPRNRQYRSPFFDIERVEVVKGPQAVYFGLNSTAGAVSITTRKTRPGDGFDAFVSADYGLDIGGQSIEGAMGVSGDKIGLRVAGKYVDNDGYFQNTTTGLREGDEKSVLIRGSFVIDAAEGFRLSGKVEHSDYDISGNVGEIFDSAGDPSQVLDYVRTADATNLWTGGVAGFVPGGGPRQDATAENFQLTAEVDVAGGLLTATYGKSDFDYILNTDLDTSALAQLDAAIEEDYSQSSVDIRYQNQVSEQFNLLVGGYYHDTSFFNAQPNVWGLQFPWNAILAGAVGQPTADALFPQNSILQTGTLYDLDTKLTSLYGIGEFTLSDQLTISAGARWAEEEKHVIRGINCMFATADGGTTFAPASSAFLGAVGACPNPALAAIDRERKSDNLMPEASLQYRPNEDTMFFAKIGKSAKAGGFASSSSIDPNFLEYDDESVVGYELGVKSRLMGGKAELNATLFRADFDDLQVNSFVVNPQTNLPQAVLDNAAKAKSQGIEIDGRLAVNESITAGMSVAYLDAKYDDFPSAPCSRAGSANPNGALAGTCNFTGLERPYAPEYSGNVYFDLDHNMGGSLSLIGGAKVAFSGSYYTDGTLEEPGRQGSWEKIDARIGVAHDKGWELSVIGTNLTDEKVTGASQALLGYMLGYLEPPRQVVLRAKWQY